MFRVGDGVGSASDMWDRREQPVLLRYPHISQCGMRIHESAKKLHCSCSINTLIREVVKGQRAAVFGMPHVPGRTWQGKLRSLGVLHMRSSGRLSVTKRSQTVYRRDTSRPSGRLCISVFEGGIRTAGAINNITEGSVQSTSRNSCLNPSMIP